MWRQFFHKGSFKERKRIEHENRILNSREDRKKKLTLLFFTSGMTLFLISSLYLWQFTRIVHYNRKIFNLKKRVQILTQENLKFKTDVSALSSISRIKSIASEKIGMENPQKIVFLNLGN